MALKLKLTPDPNRALLYRAALPPYRVTLHAARVGTCFKHAVFLRCGAEAAFGPVFADFNVVTPTPQFVHRFLRKAAFKNQFSRVRRAREE